MFKAAEAQVELKNVGKTFPPTRATASLHALGPLDLDIRRGEFFAVVGPSGCGKSTLLEIIAGLTPTSDGSVAFEGKRIAGEAPEGIGVVFQEDASLPWLNVADNVAFGLRRSSLSRDERDQQCAVEQTERPEMIRRGNPVVLRDGVQTLGPEPRQRLVRHRDDDEGEHHEQDRWPARHARANLRRMTPSTLRVAESAEARRAAGRFAVRRVRAEVQAGGRGAAVPQVRLPALHVQIRALPGVRHSGRGFRRRLGTGGDSG